MFILVLFLKFSLGGSHHVHCPFLAGESKGGNLLLFCLYCLCFQLWPFCADSPPWEVYLSPDSRSVFLYLTSATPATFSAQLCVLEGRTCTPVGEIHSVTTVSANLYSRGQIMHKRILHPVFFLKLYVFLHLLSSGSQMEKTADRKMKVPVYVLAQKTCVQVDTRADKG